MCGRGRGGGRGGRIKNNFVEWEVTDSESRQLTLIGKRGVAVRWTRESGAWRRGGGGGRKKKKKGT